MNASQSDELTYFAYGSNMCTARLRARVPSANPVGVARLPGHALKFQKRSADGSAKCNVGRADAGPEVVGVLFRILSTEKAALDDAEGVGNGYREERVEVLTEAGAEPCFLYLADKGATDDSLQPYDW